MSTADRGCSGAPAVRSRAMAGSRDRIGLALGVTGVVLFAGTLPITRLVVAEIDPLFLTAARAAIAGCAGLVVLLLTRPARPPRELWAGIAGGGLCSVVGFPVFTALAMMSVPAAHGGVVLGIVPLATAAAAALVARERPSAGFWAASCAGAAIVIAFVLDQSPSRSFTTGDLYLFGTVLAGAFGYALSGHVSARMPGWQVISWQVAMLLPLSALATYLWWPPNLGTISPRAWAGIAYVGLVSQYLAFFVFNAAMAMAGVARAGQLMLLQPFVIVVLAALINSEPLRLTTLAYAGAVVLMVVVGQRMQVRRQAPPAA
jgi:drug/metabolite transporter (DMT)-like permease